jgi:hypothetical protein|nr:MAG TPA: endosialidase chaperone [Caudoviricetes sp.]
MGEKNTVDVLFKRDTLENIRNTPLKDGQVLWTIDQEGNDKIYNDVRQSDNTIKRTQIGGTIQVDQDFDKESPYPLANKKIVNGLKDFIPAYAKDLDVLTNALLISTTNENFDLNKTQLVVSGTTTNMPDDCQDGVREVGKNSNNNTYVRIFGRDKYGVSTEWLNSWNGTSWLGWARVITNIDRFIGYDNTINGIQYSTRINKPTGSESDIAFEILKGQNRQSYIDYSGNALFSTISIKGADNSSNVVINSNRDIVANNITSDNNLTAKNGIISSLTVTNSLVSNGLIFAHSGVSFGGTSTIINSGNNLVLTSLSGNVRIKAAGATEVVIWDDPQGSVEGADGGGVLSPESDAIMKLGTTNHAWQSVYCKGVVYGGTFTQVSDKKAKTHIAYLKDENKLDEFYMNLKPVEYKWKDNGHRTHLGFYAQDIAENAKNTIGDLSMYQARQIEVDEKGRDIEKPYRAGIEDKDLKWTLSYDELIAPTVAIVQKQQKEIEQLKQQIENLKR